MNAGEEISVEQALDEIGRVDRKMRRSARWGSRYFLVFGVVTGVYWAITHFAPGALADAVYVAWLVFSVGSAFYLCRNRVHGRVFWRFQYVVTGLFLTATIFNVWVMRQVQEGEGAWPVLVGVAGIVFAAGPPLYGGWRGLTALEDGKGPVEDR